MTEMVGQTKLKCSFEDDQIESEKKNSSSIRKQF